MDETRGQLQHMDNLFYRRLDFFTELAGCRSIFHVFCGVFRVANSILYSKAFESSRGGMAEKILSVISLPT